MNPAAISNLSNTYLQSFLGNLQGTGSANGAIGSTQSSQNNSTQDSTFADLMSTIQQFQSDSTMSQSSFPAL
ncbi:MAG: hypothetical protein ABSH56_24550 [Bryobacteraceae bacterium]|jgi:hypothetical protein